MATIEQIKELREMTGVSISKCKEALEQTNGDMEKAKELLRKMGQDVADKKLSRVAKNGIIDSYIHFSKQLGVLLDLRCETDFVARSAEFQELSHDICLHIVASRPEYVKPEDVPAEIIAKEQEIYKEEMAKLNKPAEIMEKMMAGKLNKFYEEKCLLNQKFVKDDSKTVQQFLVEKIQKIGENMIIHRFSIFDI